MANIYAPWPEDMVRRLNKHQRSGKMHPFTCPNRADGMHFQLPGQDLGQLVAHTDGWHCPECGYRQVWASDFMVNAIWE